jgi:peptide deformylase
MVKKILIAPNKKLSQKCSSVAVLDKKSWQIMRNLADTLLCAKDPEGVGLAAPQIGALKRIFVLKGSKGKVDYIINPEITHFSKETNFDVLNLSDRIKEGCLSVPDVYDFVERAWKIKVGYKNSRFEVVEKELEGLDAEIFQHELDHLDGILFTQRVLEAGRR